jgi:hypothetical protein
MCVQLKTWYTGKMNWDEQGLEELIKLLPEGWEQKAKELDAIRRRKSCCW